MKISAHAPTDEMQALMTDMKAAIGRHPGLGGVVTLACVSQLVGNLVALQDQRRWTAEQVMDLVAKNIEEGNRRAVSVVAETKGTA